jgi:hypothetical protein
VKGAGSCEFDLSTFAQLTERFEDVSESVLGEELAENCVDVDCEARILVLVEDAKDRPIGFLGHALQDLVRLNRRLIHVQQLGPVDHSTNRKRD